MHSAHVVLGQDEMWTQSKMMPAYSRAAHQWLIKF